MRKLNPAWAKARRFLEVLAARLKVMPQQQNSPTWVCHRPPGRSKHQPQVLSLSSGENGRSVLWFPRSRYRDQGSHWSSQIGLTIMIARTRAVDGGSSTAREASHREYDAVTRCSKLGAAKIGASVSLAWREPPGALSWVSLTNPKGIEPRSATLILVCERLAHLGLSPRGSSSAQCSS